VGFSFVPLLPCIYLIISHRFLILQLRLIPICIKTVAKGWKWWTIYVYGIHSLIVVAFIRVRLNQDRIGGDRCDDGG